MACDKCVSEQAISEPNLNPPPSSQNTPPSCGVGFQVILAAAIDKQVTSLPTIACCPRARRGQYLCFSRPLGADALSPCYRPPAERTANSVSGCGRIPSGSCGCRVGNAWNNRTILPTAEDPEGTRRCLSRLRARGGRGLSQDRARTNRD